MGRPHMGNSRVTVHQDLKQNWANGEAVGFKIIKASGWFNCDKVISQEDQEVIDMIVKWLNTNSYTVGVQIQEKAGDNFIKLLSVNLFGNTEE